ncbi:MULTISPECIES: surface carbohydrate biosynthesis protein [Clostridia]|uniref:surface carbohydrate biosynthesis protein n=1 Tax=Clostridia TaxID=186801 RepID=UPI000EA28F2A|nr:MULTISPECIES: surface carbohydrate biosynthesis protein [Clostridia]NBJ71657.1 hypothetical protein [Roseburia sp. 1XD42-34]RKI73940.1 hypothetical protein D7V87_19725 [Clostridium sp. 1xD42-85]
MSVKKKWLYLPVEVKVRELDAKLLLSYYAASQGYAVIIGEHKMVELALNHYPSGVFFSKGYPYHVGQEVITSVKQKGHKIVELDEEGLIIQGNDLYLQDRARGELQIQLEQIYCWGDFQKQILSRSSKAIGNKSHVTGSPRIDLLTPKYREVYTEEVKQLRSQYGTFILVNTRFSQYNAVSGIKEVHPQSKYMKRLYEYFLQMITDVSKVFPQLNIIIRPHPGENFTVYKQIFSSQANIHVLHEGNIIKWLLAADVVIHNGCTSSVEAFLLEKNIITYVPITSSVYDVELPNQLGVKATNNQEVVDIIQLMLDKSELSLTMQSRTELENNLDHYCSHLNPYFSFERILHLINTIPTPASTYNPASYKPLYAREKKYIKYFFSSLNSEEIEKFFIRLNRIEGRDLCLSIKKVARNLFQIN